MTDGNILANFKFEEADKEPENRVVADLGSLITYLKYGYEGAKRDISGMQAKAHCRYCDSWTSVVWSVMSINICDHCHAIAYEAARGLPRKVEK